LLANFLTDPPKLSKLVSKFRFVRHFSCRADAKGDASCAAFGIRAAKLNALRITPHTRTNRSRVWGSEDEDPIAGLFDQDPTRLQEASRGNY
jgi:hypothetical protein